MLSVQEQLDRIRPEVRYLRIRVAQLDRARLANRKRGDILEEENNKLRQENNQLHKEKQKLEEELEKIKRQRDTYKGMVFKPESTCHKQSPNTPLRKPGGQTGHKGYGRHLSKRIDRIRRIFFHHCPTCGGKLRRSGTTLSHTIEDIPSPQTLQTIITQYHQERQWCGTCKKEIVATPPQVIPHSRLGMNLIIQILVWRYAGRLPFDTISELLSTTYGISVSRGAIIMILKRTKGWFGSLYTKLLADIRSSPIKHADETGWRINGENGWLWAFLTKDSVYYTIEETRGKGIAEKILSASKTTDILVRDDYPGYKKLPLQHQSCWAHPLRIGHDFSTAENASKEVKKLHAQLKILFDLLSEDISQPFDLKERQKLYGWYQKDLQKIRDASYESADARKLQTRIRNQNTNLLTALLNQGVPLTNNAAERAIRPMVVTRKISGGSRSYEGAATHAVNMSVVQTIKMKNQSLIPTLHALLLQGVFEKN